MHKLIYKNIFDENENFDIDHRNEHKDFEYIKKNLVKRSQSDQSIISLIEVPPGKSSVPNHYHEKNEEAFLIISGKGFLKTSEGEKKVVKGDFFFFPANKDGAHKITNTSKNETLVYMDFSTKNSLDVCVYPDSNKIGVWGQNASMLFDLDDGHENYYENE